MIDDQLIIKVAIAAGAVVVGYVVVKIVSSLLAGVVVWSIPEAQKRSDVPSDSKEESGDNIENVPGLHVLSGLPSEHRFIDENPTEKMIRTTITGLDWSGEFHQVLLISSPGVCFAVGGSLDPTIGLSSSYSDEKKGERLVINEAPTTVAKMEELMVSFFYGDGRWKHMNTYE